MIHWIAPYENYNRILLAYFSFFPLYVNYKRGWSGFLLDQIAQMLGQEQKYAETYVAKTQGRVT